MPGTGDTLRVTSLALPNCQLLGTTPPELGMLEHLQYLDLSNNLLNGSLPASLFNASELRTLSLSNNVISGALPETIGGLKNLEFLNLSANALAGKIPQNLTALRNLTVVSLSNNYFSGGVPSVFEAVQVLDLSSNLINGSFPSDFGGVSLRYLNLSYNRLVGRIPPEFGKQIPGNVTLDLSFNNLTGEIPENVAFLNQKTESFAGNPDLCGKPLKNLCAVTSVLSAPSNVSEITSPPAFAAIPNTIDSTPVAGSSGTLNGTQQERERGLRPGTIAGIIFGDLAGIGVLAMIFFYVYRIRKRRKKVVSSTGSAEKKDEMDGKDIWPLSSTEPKGPACWCLGKKNDDGEETSETTSTDSDEDEEEKVGDEQKKKQQEQKGGSLVTVDGETELELETLLKASAYILGATSASIVYKAVLEDGTTLAVRRIGESGIERYRDFENQVKLIAKLRHPNLVRIRGFYWGSEEKLVIYDYVPCGSLANFSYSKFFFSLLSSLSDCFSQSVWCIVAKTSKVVLKCTVMLVSLCKGARSYSQCPESQLSVVGRWPGFAKPSVLRLTIAKTLYPILSITYQNETLRFPFPFLGKV
uniref:Serine-threonine/tyrosine-protein kinase catalytic domain-containing protein n=1 Tax=Nelumbo nucifera TaxID=4432 RepID=A0A822Z9X1_NELNU|nr:TPA_asm: hypothetical protein HUJ06_015693 [Nelumbo nucifera]